MKYILLFSFFGFFLFSGCGTTTRMTNSWKSEKINQDNVRNIIVLGLMRNSDATLREKMEQHLVDDLKALGYDAICSCNEYNPDAFKNMSEVAAINKLRNAGADAVLTIVLLDIKRESYYMPGKVLSTQNIYYQNSFWNYSRMMFEKVNEEAYYIIDTKYFWESNLFDLKENKLIYSAKSQSFDPGSTERLGHEYGKVIVNDLVKKKVLTSVPKVKVLKAM